MKLTPHIPLILQRFEIGRRTLIAILAACFTVFCLSVLLFSCNNEQTIAKDFQVVKTGTAIPVNQTVHTLIHTEEEKAKKDKVKPANKKTRQANSFYHISAILSPEGLRKRGLPEKEIEILRTTCEKYVERYAPIAIVEMKQFGIPASITLAQGLLESDAGNSRLAKANNNHFGIKCFSKKCAKGHCSNFSDDHHKDFFRKYTSVWRSYRDHSNFLKKSRYRKCFRLERRDYKGWARELKKAGYATDERYADKLMEIIEGMSLWNFDS
jgi:flagellum-specific peptidoglycan hydrolase FlgJ